MKRTISSDGCKKQLDFSMDLTPKKKIKYPRSISADTLRERPKFQFNKYEYLYPLLEKLNYIVLDFKNMNLTHNNFLEQFLLYIVFKDCPKELLIKILNHLEFDVVKIENQRYYLKRRDKSEIVKLVLSECDECDKFSGRTRTSINLDYSVINKYTSIDRFYLYLSTYNNNWINVSYSPNTEKVSLLIK